MLEKVVIVVHLLMALGLVGLILVQHGKGADAGVSFGAGASATVFGSQGSATFLSRITGILAAVFFLTSLGLAYFAKEKSDALQHIGLPDPAVLEQKQEKAPAADDVPVLQEQSKPAESAGDVPAAPEQK
ncbi:preprotein translocase subunit SecG [Pseudomonas aeruginosa]|nr:preprotein translocase subunit SecG [Pseudomonas aeruginosa]